MRTADYIILALLALCVAAAVIFLIRQRKRGGCCGNCSACGSCPECTGKKENAENHPADTSEK